METTESRELERLSLIQFPKPEEETYLMVQSDTHWEVGSLSEIVYFCQIINVYAIIITSIINLLLQNGSSELWISLLSSCIGYAFPSPKL